MEKVGFVRRITDDTAELEIKRASGCGSCNGCAGGCEVKSQMIIVKNNLNAKVGDFVELRGETKSILKYMFIIYMIPFVFLVGGIVLGNNYFMAAGNPNFELLSFATGIIALFISFFIVRVIDKNIAKTGKVTIEMTKIL